MSRCFQRDSQADLERMELSDGFWVKIKRRLSYEDHQEIQYALSEGGEILDDPDGGKRVRPTKSGIKNGDIVTLLMSIKEWNFTDDPSVEVGSDNESAYERSPIDEAHIRVIDPEWGSLISAEVLRRNPFLAGGQSSGTKKSGDS